MVKFGSRKRRRVFEPRRRRAKKTFYPLRLVPGGIPGRPCKRKLYGRHLRRARMWMFTPRVLMVGHPDCPDITRQFERGLLSLTPANFPGRTPEQIAAASRETREQLARLQQGLARQAKEESRKT